MCHCGPLLLGSCAWCAWSWMAVLCISDVQVKAMQSAPVTYSNYCFGRIFTQKCRTFLQRSLDFKMWGVMLSVLVPDSAQLVTEINLKLHVGRATALLLTCSKPQRVGHWMKVPMQISVFGRCFILNHRQMPRRDYFHLEDTPAQPWHPIKLYLMLFSPSCGFAKMNFPHSPQRH